MKRNALFLLFVLLFGVSVNAAQPTVEDIVEKSKPEILTEKEGAVRIESEYFGTDDSGAVISRVYKKEGDYIVGNEFYDNQDQTFQHFYFSSQPDTKLQYKTNETEGIEELTSELKEQIFASSLFGYEAYTEEITSVEETDTQYIVQLNVSYADSVIMLDTVTLEKEGGWIQEVKRVYTEPDTDVGKEDPNVETGMMFHITYSEEEEVEVLVDETALSQAASGLSFSTVDHEGNPVTTEIFAGAKVVMVNFWEPWCGPCVGEMPDLQTLYEKYKDQGLCILGVYSPDNDAASVEEVLSDTKAAYPIIQADSSLSALCTQYVPTTVFADGEGNILTEEPYIGAKSLEEWEEIIQHFL